MRRRHYSIHTERSYCGWVKRLVLHFNMKSRNDLTEGEKKIERYLTSPFITSYKRDLNLPASQTHLWRASLASGQEENSYTKKFFTLIA